MTTYLTKVWGLDEPIGPLQFSASGWRDTARALLRPGDLVVLVGTKNEPTADADRGRLLGLMEPSTEPVMSLDFDLRNAPTDFDEAGNYKWPYGLLNRAAWLLLDKPLLTEISARRFNMDSVQGIVALTGEEAAAVARLRRRAAALLEPRVRARQRVERGAGKAARMTAPPPTTHRAGIMHMRDAPASTYLMRVEGTRPSCFKIGWAFDYRLRERGFNRAALPGLGGVRYRTVLYELWDSAREAFRMEQHLLGQFGEHRSAENHEVVAGLSQSEIEAAWIAYLVARS